MKATKSNDIDLRLAVTRALLDAGHPRDAIRHEITLDSSSSDGRADMVLAHDRMLVGIELKSGKDTLDRLESQRERYGARFDLPVLVVNVSHVPDERKPSDERLRFPCVRLFAEGRIMGRYEGSWNNVSSWKDAPWEADVPLSARRLGAGERQAPHAMLSMLWADEALNVAAKLVQAGVIPPAGGGQRYRVIPHAAEHASIAQLRPCVATVLRARQLNRWEKAFWTRFDNTAVVDGQRSAAA